MVSLHKIVRTWETIWGRNLAEPSRNLRQYIGELMEQMFLQVRPLALEAWPLTELTIPQLRAFFLLQARGPLRMGDLAAHLGVSLPAATNVVEKLAEKGLVSREHDPTDRRVVRCQLTSQGRETAEQFWRVRKEHLDRMAEALTEEELGVVARALELLLKAKGSGGPEPGV